MDHAAHNEIFDVSFCMCAVAWRFLSFGDWKLGEVDARVFEFLVLGRVKGIWTEVSHTFRSQFLGCLLGRLVIRASALVDPSGAASWSQCAPA